jgi:hypothetical protein
MVAAAGVPDVRSGAQRTQARRVCRPNLCEPVGRAGGPFDYRGVAHGRVPQPAGVLPRAELGVRREREHHAECARTRADSCALCAPDFAGRATARGSRHLLLLRRRWATATTPPPRVSSCCCRGWQRMEASNAPTSYDSSKTATGNPERDRESVKQFAEQVLAAMRKTNPEVVR